MELIIKGHMLFVKQRGKETTATLDGIPLGHVDNLEHAVEVAKDFIEMRWRK